MFEESPKPKKGWQNFAPLLGCGVGGCFIPLLLFLFCGLFLHDTGGPLFWPMIAVPLAIIGLGIGVEIRRNHE
jgi:hypothetical protein